MDEGLQIWNDTNESVTIDNKKQKSWDMINVKRICENMTFKSEIEKLRFDSLQNNFSGAWLTAVPNPNLGTLLNNDTMRTCVGLRLGANICQPHSCECGASVDQLGRHGLSCLYNKGKYSRHSELNKILQQCLASINVSCRLEPDGLFRRDGKRVDGITNTPWNKGRALVWDATCADTFAKSYFNGKPGNASRTAIKKKHHLYEEIEQNYTFVAFAVETIGPWAKESEDFINVIGKKLIKVTGDKRSRLYLIQRLSLAIQRGNFECVSGTLPKSEGLNEIFYI